MALGLAAAFALAACGSDSKSSGTAAPGATTAPGATGAPAAGGKIAVSLITKDSTNPFFVAMQAGAKKAGTTAGVDITIASGKAEGDDQGQIDATKVQLAYCRITSPIDGRVGLRFSSNG